jgi:hypothetical protein
MHPVSWRAAQHRSRPLHPNLAVSRKTTPASQTRAVACPRESPTSSSHQTGVGAGDASASSASAAGSEVADDAGDMVRSNATARCSACRGTLWRRVGCAMAEADCVPPKSSCAGALFKAPAPEGVALGWQRSSERRASTLHVGVLNAAVPRRDVSTTSPRCCRSQDADGCTSRHRLCEDDYNDFDSADVAVLCPSPPPRSPYHGGPLEEELRRYRSYREERVAGAVGTGECDAARCALSVGGMSRPSLSQSCGGGGCGSAAGVISGIAREACVSPRKRQRSCEYVLGLSVETSGCDRVDSKRAAGSHAALISRRCAWPTHLRGPSLTSRDVIYKRTRFDQGGDDSDDDADQDAEILMFSSPDVSQGGDAEDGVAGPAANFQSTPQGIRTFALCSTWRTPGTQFRQSCARTARTCGGLHDGAVLTRDAALMRQTLLPPRLPLSHLPWLVGCAGTVGTGDTVSGVLSDADAATLLQRHETEMLLEYTFQAHQQPHAARTTGRPPLWVDVLRTSLAYYAADRN